MRNIEEFEYNSSSLLKLQNEIMRIYLSLAITPQKSCHGDYAKHNRTNKINYVRQTLLFPKLSEKFLLKLTLKH